jgi:hypothetical protein|nr:MAG TPA: hypothetical protein [Bacteriophage sp.]
MCYYGIIKAATEDILFYGREKLNQGIHCRSVNRCDLQRQLMVIIRIIICCKYLGVVTIISGNPKFSL